MEKRSTHDHPIHELLARRWSPVAFDPRPLPRAQLASLLEAARWAPSCFNEQPWRFIVAPRDDADDFATALGCLAEGNQAWAKNASALIFTAAKQTFARNGKPNRYAAHDVGLAVENLVIQAMADGLFVHQMAGILHDRIRDTYGVPAEFEILTGVAVGYPGDVDELPEDLKKRQRGERSRHPLGEIAFTGSWSSPFRP